MGYNAVVISLLQFFLDLVKCVLGFVLICTWRRGAKPCNIDYVKT